MIKTAESAKREEKLNTTNEKTNVKRIRKTSCLPNSFQQQEKEEQAILLHNIKTKSDVESTYKKRKVKKLEREKN